MAAISDNADHGPNAETAACERWPLERVSGDNGEPDWHDAGFVDDLVGGPGTPPAPPLPGLGGGMSGPGSGGFIDNDELFPTGIASAEEAIDQADEPLFEEEERRDDDDGSLPPLFD